MATNGILDAPLLDLINDLGAALTKYDGIERPPVQLQPVKARSPDTFICEDRLVDVIATYRVLNVGWWFEGDRPEVQIVSCVLDGNGSEQFTVPPHFFSSKQLADMECQIADELEAECPPEQEHRDV